MCSFFDVTYLVIVNVFNICDLTVMVSWLPNCQAFNFVIIWIVTAINLYFSSLNNDKDWGIDYISNC